MDIMGLEEYNLCRHKLVILDGPLEGKFLNFKPIKDYQRRVLSLPISTAVVR